MNRIITLTTDFGLSDGFVGMMKGVILNINPQANIIDITHDIAPQNIEQGAFLFANVYKYFPANTVHVVVVDPGVGSLRRPIAAQIGETLFVAPDNGVLDYVLRRAQPAVRIIHLNKPDYWRPQISNTFHGRDIFAPVAAHLSLGVPLETMGEPMGDWVKLSACKSATRMGNEIIGQVTHIDRFGNLITNVGEELLAGMDRTRIVVTLRNQVVRGVRSTYAMVAPGEVLALISSSGTLEVAVREGNAAQRLIAQLGDEVIVRGM